MRRWCDVGIACAFVVLTLPGLGTKSDTGETLRTQPSVAASLAAKVWDAQHLYLPAVFQNRASPLGPATVVGGTPRGAAQDGSLMFLAYRGRIDIVDFGDPLHARRLSVATWSDMDDTWAVSARAGMAAVITCNECGNEAIDPTATLRVLDARSPTTPRWAGEMLIEQHVAGLAMTEGFVYLSTSRDGIVVVDIHNPDHPERIGTVAGVLGQLGVVDGALVATSGVGGIQVFHLADPASPALVGSQTDTLSGLGSVSDLAVAGRYLAVSWFMGHDAGVRLWDIVDPRRPHVVASAGVYRHYLGRDDISWVGDRLFVARTNAVVVYDVTDPERPVTLGQVDMEEGMQAVTGFAGHGLAITRRGTVAVLNAPAAAPPQIVALYGGPLGGDVTEAAGEGSVVFVQGTAPEGRLDGVDLADLDAPRWAASVPLDTTEGAAPQVSDGHLFVGTEGGLAVLDAANAGNPHELARIELGWQPRLLAVAAGRVIAASHRRLSLHAWDAGDPLVIQPLARWSLPIDTSDVAMSADGQAVYALGTTWTSPPTTELLAFDLGVPNEPALTAEIPVAGGQLALVGTGLFIARGAEGLAAYSVADPLHPAPIGTLSVEAEALAGVGSDWLFVAGNGRLQQIDVTDPGRPSIVRSDAVPDLAQPHLIVASGRVWYWAPRGPGWYGFPLVIR